ncbi:cupin domain-containing protein [Ruania alkalisoli]|uniref:Cupin domain-containing protein n=1 Tax=Ruania alkalisoli TaxID=2779775 RepID=A0A7M1STZ4_9MICO|nr:cupin domain-containing protein [Ruania alkalisoli]QOR70951.1 cupin domain-containing protein [Ruania alkalisoli]
MIGGRLRDLRAEQDLSLRALAERTGLSATLLSQIERGKVEPSLKSLRLLASVLGQSVGELFDSSESLTVRISRPGERSRITSPRGYIQYERLAPSNGQLEVLRGVLAPGEVSSDEPWSHPSIECVVVLAGTLTVHVAETAHEVTAGESVTFDSRQPHRYQNVTDGVVEFLVSVAPPSP